MSLRTPNSVYPSTIQNLHLYRIRAFDPYPDLTHAIFTRQGGVSQAPYHSLNLGSAVGDDPEAVKKNYQHVCQSLEISPDQTVSCHLIHSSNILTINETNRRSIMGKADGLITDDPGIYLFMRFGDCTPLIFYDTVQGAIGLTHAGWRGTLQNAAGATVAALVNQLGCRPQNIIAAIGPAIGPCCYEVGSEVIAAATKVFGDTDSLFISHNGRSNHAHFDMVTANKRQLAEAGVGQIIQSGLCTACRSDEFFSHRAEKGRTGRFGVIIGMKGTLSRGVCD